MATIKEDYVSFEIAKLLVKKGFDYSAEYESYYTLGGTIVYFKDNPQDINIAPRITLQMAMKWLLKKYNIFICSLFLEQSNRFGYAIENIIKKKYITVSNNSYKEPEQAYEAAIKYCLEKLI